MNKQIIKVITIILLAIMVVIGVLIGFNFTRLGQSLQKSSSYSVSRPPNYRYMVILDGTDPSFIEEIKIGMDKASEDYSVVYELWSFSGKDRLDRIVRQLDVGIESQVDGILLQVSEDARFNDLLVKAKRKGVPIITLTDDVPSQEKVSYISYNKYQMGSKIGSLLKTQLALGGKDRGTIAIIQNSTVFDQDQAFAIQDELDKGFVVKPIKVTSENERILNAEGLARKIMEENDDLCGFICLSNDETLGVIQALKDTNKIGELIVIGTGNSLESIEYVRKGIMAATIIPDIENIGYEALFDLTKYNDGLFVSQYRDIFVKIIDRENLEAYLKEEANR